MDKTEKLMKQYLTQRMAFGGDSRRADCLAEDVLLEYLAGSLDEQRRHELEHHLADCGFCLSRLDIAFGAQILNKPRRVSFVSPALLTKTKAALDIVESVKDDTNHKRRLNRRRSFLLGTIFFFLWSFVIPRYFLQFLVASLILGIRWSFESESGHTIIMILDSWRRHSHDKDDEISRRLKNRR